MAIWNLLRDFFVQYIFGGYTSTGIEYRGVIGITNSGSVQNSQNTFINFGEVFTRTDGSTLSISIGDYLSTTATIITLVVFVGILFLFLKWLFKVISGFILLK